MKITLISSIVISLIVHTVAFAQAPPDQSPRKPNPGEETPGAPDQTIQAYLDSLATENKLSGAVLVAKDGVPIASKAAGIANKATDASNTLETKFNLGSLNKMFTGIAVSQLAQQGKLKFSDPISKVLPDYPNKEIAAKVTIHQLLTHTSGMGSYINDKYRAERATLTTIASHFPLFVNDPLLFPPGEKFQYSNAGYMVLGAIIERLSGQDYYAYINEHVFAPAGMTNSGFYEPGKEIPNLAIGYTRMGPDGKRTEEIRDNIDRLEIRGGPAGGGYSTVGDLVRFHQALRNFKLLDREHTKLALEGKVDAGPIGRYGYGFGDSVSDGKHIVGHNGGWPGVAADFRMYPELGYTTVVLMNSDPPTMMPVVKQIHNLIR